MRSARALVFAAVVTSGVGSTPRDASAQRPPPEPPATGFVERARVLGGLTHEIRGPATLSDYWVGVTPELLFFVIEPRWQLRGLASATASTHTVLADEISGRLGLATIAELSKRTTQFVSAEANLSTLSNLLLTRPATATPIGIVPTTRTRILTATGTQALSWEASPVVRLEERVDASFLRSLDEGAPLQGRFAHLTLGGERSWKVDAVGVEARGGYSYARTPALAGSQRVVDLSTGTRWRHDFTRSLTGSAVAGPAMIVGLSRGTRPKLTPAARIALVHWMDPTTVELTYEHGFTPSLFTGQVVRAHQAMLRLAVPLSERERVYLGASAGWMHAAYVDLDRDAPPAREFDAGLGDVDLAWSPLRWLAVFGRYQIVAQTRGVTFAGDTAFTRHAVIVGVELSSSADTASTSIRVPRRVDRTDVAR
jgi:hypothetical protein